MQKFWSYSKNHPLHGLVPRQKEAADALRPVSGQTLADDPNDGAG